MCSVALPIVVLLHTVGGPSVDDDPTRRGLLWRAARGGSARPSLVEFGEI